MKRICSELVVPYGQLQRLPMPNQTWFLIIVLLLMQFGLSAQYTVTRCSDLSPRPISYDPTTRTNKDILAVYLDGDGSGAPGEGCWVYHHRNGKDYVVISDSWHTNMTDGYRDLIGDIMQAMTDARRVYADYGSLDVSLYYLFEPGQTPSYRSFAHWLVDNRSKCWMQSELNNFNGSTRERSKFTFAHEIAHCFIMENVKDLQIKYKVMNAWFDESISEFLASEVYPELNKEFEQSRQFDLDNTEFTQKYKAWPLWYYYVLQKGKSALVPEMNRMISYHTRPQRLGYFRRTGFDKIHHNFLVDFYTRNLEDRGGGQIDIEEAIRRRIPAIPLVPDPAPPPINLVEIQPERMSLYILELPPGYDLSIHPPAEGAEKIRYSILSKPDIIKNWDAEALVEGYCDRPRKVQILASHLNEDTISDIEITYELNERVSCCTLTTAITDNPSPEELDGQFHFDYYIESEVEMTADGSTRKMPMNYFVNSRDGSMLLLRSFFMDNFGTFADGGMKADAVIWLANGQLVAYVQDSTFSQKRAITLDMNQTRADVMGPRAINPEELLREGRNSGISPAALPSDSPWSGQATAYTYYREERFEPDVRNLMTSYVSNDNSVVASPMSSFGFMVGHIKDLSGQNKHLVYTRYETPGGDVMKAKLHKLEKECASFNGAGYKKMTLGGSTGAIGAMSESEREDFLAQQLDYNAQMGALLTELGRCGDDEFCTARIQEQMLQLQREKENSIYDLNPNTTFTGTSGSDFQSQERALRDRMYALQDQMIEQERRCATLDDNNNLCGGCMEIPLRQCIEQLEELKDQMDQLECRMAQLHGAGDMLDDCH